MLYSVEPVLQTPLFRDQIHFQDIFLQNYFFIITFGVKRLKQSKDSSAFCFPFAVSDLRPVNGTSPSSTSPVIPLPDHAHPPANTQRNIPHSSQTPTVESNSVPHKQRGDSDKKEETISDHKREDGLYHKKVDTLSSDTLTLPVTSSMTDQSDISTSTPSSLLPKPTPTRRKIYVRGHLLSHKAASRHFHPADPEGNKMSAAGDNGGPIPQKHIGGLGQDIMDECPPAATNCHEDTSQNVDGKSRHKKHNPQRKKFHNYKMLSDGKLIVSMRYHD